MCLPYVSSNIFRLDDHESWSFEGYWNLMLYQPCDPMRRCGSFLMTPGWSYVSFGAVACHARNQLWWSNVLRQGNLRIPPIWGSFQREKSFCNLSKHERLFMDCEPAPMVCHDWWSQAWPCLSCFFARSNASTTWFSDVVCHGESSTGQSNPSVTPNDWQWETPKIESFCPKKGDWEESWIYDACHVKPDAPLERQVLEKALMCLMNVFKKVSMLMTSLKKMTSSHQFGGSKHSW